MMKKMLWCLPLLIMTWSLSLKVFAQKEVIEGNWLDEDKKGKVKIFKATNGKYYGKIIWLKEPNMKNGQPKVDLNNPKEANRSNPVMGMQLLRGFEKESATLFEGGTIYDPQSGKTYSCKITVKDKNTLNIRGFIGVSMLGRTTVWTRSE